MPDFDKISAVLSAGGVIAYPTETVYGLGCNAYAESAVARIVDMKGRLVEKGLLVLIGHTDQLDEIAEEISPEARLLMSEFWPGPLTLIFKASMKLPESVTGGMGSVGVRISPDPICVSLMEHYHHPLVSTSANPAGKPPAMTAKEVVGYFPEGPDLIIDGGERRTDLVSTLIDMRSAPARLLRRGVITSQEIERKTGVMIEI